MPEEEISHALPEEGEYAVLHAVKHNFLLYLCGICKRQYVSAGSKFLLNFTHITKPFESREGLK